MKSRILMAGLATVALVVSTSTGVSAWAGTGQRPAPAAVRSGDGTPGRATGDPSHNISPSQSFFEHCQVQQRTKAEKKACDRVGVAELDKARKSEGLPPMTLPNGFDGMSVPVQLLVLSNVERVDRGLVPIKSLSPELDKLAQKGARNNTDPGFENPFPGDAGGANWSGYGPSSLLNDFVWMYDDGYHSGNGDCTSPHASGCWGHRHDILGVHQFQGEPNKAYDEPLLMGAAEAHHGGSMTEEFVSGDHKDHTQKPYWTSLRKKFPVGVSARSVTESGGKARLTAFASGQSMQVTATVISGASAWSVSPSSFSLQPGRQRNLTLTYQPSGGSKTPGVLRLSTAIGKVKVALEP